MIQTLTKPYLNDPNQRLNAVFWRSGAYPPRYLSLAFRENSSELWIGTALVVSCASLSKYQIQGC